jgi:hypothetical protein
MNTEELKAKLSKQYLIASYIENKLQIVNFIKTGYEENKPVLINNRFLHFTAHIYYRSIIIDLYALLGPANGNNKHAFRHILQDRPADLKPTSLDYIQSLLIEATNDISIVKNLRHTEMAHYDFTINESISLNFDNLSVINKLFQLSKTIIIEFGGGFFDEDSGINYDFNRRHSYLDSLERLISKVR